MFLAITLANLAQDLTSQDRVCIGQSEKIHETVCSTHLKNTYVVVKLRSETHERALPTQMRRVKVLD